MATPVIVPMVGKIVSVSVKVGDKVKEDDQVAVLEAMKMENALPAPKAGKIKSLAHKPGDRVPRDEVLAIIA